MYESIVEMLNDLERCLHGTIEEAERLPQGLFFQPDKETRDIIQSSHKKTGREVSRIKYEMEKEYGEGHPLAMAKLERKKRPRPIHADIVKEEIFNIQGLITNFAGAIADIRNDIPRRYALLYKKLDKEDIRVGRYDVNSIKEANRIKNNLRRLYTTMVETTPKWEDVTREGNVWKPKQDLLVKTKEVLQYLKAVKKIKVRSTAPSSHHPEKIVVPKGGLKYKSLGLIWAMNDSGNKFPLSPKSHRPMMNTESVDIIYSAIKLLDDLETIKRGKKYTQFIKDPSYEPFKSGSENTWAEVLGIKNLNDLVGKGGLFRRENFDTKLKEAIKDFGVPYEDIDIIHDLLSLKMSVLDTKMSRAVSESGSYVKGAEGNYLRKLLPYSLIQVVRKKIGRIIKDLAGSEGLWRRAQSLRRNWESLYDKRLEEFRKESDKWRVIYKTARAEFMTAKSEVLPPLVEKKKKLQTKITDLEANLSAIKNKKSADYTKTHDLLDKAHVRLDDMVSDYDEILNYMRNHLKPTMVAAQKEIDQISAALAKLEKVDEQIQKDPKRLFIRFDALRSAITWLRHLYHDELNIPPGKIITVERIKKGDKVSYVMFKTGSHGKEPYWTKKGHEGVAQALYHYGRPIKEDRYRKAEVGPSGEEVPREKIVSKQGKEPSKLVEMTDEYFDNLLKLAQINLLQASQSIEDIEALEKGLSDAILKEVEAEGLFASPSSEASERRRVAIRNLIRSLGKSPHETRAEEPSEEEELPKSGRTSVFVQSNSLIAKELERIRKKTEGLPL